jgi:hypothetical protein
MWKKMRTVLAFEWVILRVSSLLYLLRVGDTYGLPVDIIIMYVLPRTYIDIEVHPLWSLTGQLEMLYGIGRSSIAIGIERWIHGDS